MKISEIFKSVSFTIGFILGLVFLGFIINESIQVGFRGEFIYYYLIMGFLMLIAVGDSDSSFRFLLGLNIPALIITLLIFARVDSNHKKQGKPYRKWEW